MNRERGAECNDATSTGTESALTRGYHPATAYRSATGWLKSPEARILATLPYTGPQRPALASRLREAYIAGWRAAREPDASTPALD